MVFERARQSGDAAASKSRVREQFGQRDHYRRFKRLAIRELSRDGYISYAESTALSITRVEAALYVRLICSGDGERFSIKWQSWCLELDAGNCACESDYWSKRHQSRHRY